MKFEEKVYPFTTEVISGYFPKLNLKEKSILTVGSSLDHAFNALVLDAKEVTVYDLNKNIQELYHLKKKLILSKNRDELYSELLDKISIPITEEELFGKESVSKMNCYLRDDYSYNKLREKLKNDNNISFINGNIFDMNNYLQDKSYDRIIFSNVLQYLDKFSKENSKRDFIIEQFEQWQNHLNKDGIIQLLYLYSYNKNNIEKNAKDVIKYLCTKSLQVETFHDPINNNKEDAIVTYTKRK